MKNSESKKVDSSDIKEFIQAHVPEARLKEAQGGDLVYSLPPFNSSNASSYRSLLTALDSNLDGLQLGGYGISDTTLEEVSSHEKSQSVTRRKKYQRKKYDAICCLSKLCDGDIVFFHRRSSFNWLENTSTMRILLCPSQKPFLTRDLWIVFPQTRVMVTGTTSVSSTSFLYFVCISIFVTADLVRYDEESCCQK